MQLILVRHGESVWNAEQRWQGQTDVPLSDQGRAEAAALGQRLAGQRFDRVVTSDLQRAFDTARLAGLDAEPMVALREMDLGDWCGRPHAEIAAQQADVLRALARADEVRIPGGETLGELEERVFAALTRLSEEAADDERVAVFTHGGVVRALMLRLLQLRGRYRPLVGVSNTSITVLRRRPGQGPVAFEVARYNDASHLPAEFPSTDDVVRGAARERVAKALELDLLAFQEAPAQSTSRIHRDGAHASLRSYAEAAPL